MASRTSKEFMDKILNDIERDALASFMAQPTMVEAVKKVLLAGVYFNGTLRQGEPADPLTNFALSTAFRTGASNEDIGADIRAAAEGIRAVESGFSSLEEYKVVVEPSVDKSNPAR